MTTPRAPKPHLYRRKDGKWAWHIKAANGEIIATDHSQGYANYTDCLNSLRAVVAIEPTEEDESDD